MWFSGRLFSNRINRTTSLGIAGNWARMLLLAVTAIFVLSTLRVLSAITVCILLTMGLLIVELYKRNWKLNSLIGNLRETILRMIHKLETPSAGLAYFRRLPGSGSNSLGRWRRTNHWSAIFKEKGLTLAVILTVVMITIVLRFANALHQLRLDQVEQYAYLLRARELILDLGQGGRPFVFPTLIATTSLLSAADSMQVTRFLSPLIGIFLVLALGLFLQSCMRFQPATAAAMYCLGAAAFPSVAKQIPTATTVLQKLHGLFALSSPTRYGDTEFELGLVFVLLGLAFLAEWSWDPHGDLLLDVACCVLLAALISLFLLELLAITAVILLLRPRLAPAVFVVLCFGLAAYARLSSGSTLTNEVFPILPVAMAVAAGWLLATILIIFGPDFWRREQPLALMIFMLIAIVWLPPHRLRPEPLEYEAAARQTQEIEHKFSAQKWAVVAPVEQFSETLGLGGYEDLASFVEEYRMKVTTPDFHFPPAPQDLFIYVETRPFQMFSQEPLTVPFGILTDATYRNYRSPAGRASLESDAWRLCENYRQYHSDIDVYFQDESLLIYRIHSGGVLKTVTESSME